MRKEFVKYLDRAGTIIILTFGLVGYMLIRKGQELKNLHVQIPLILMGIALSLVGEVMTPWIRQKFPDAKRKRIILRCVTILGYLILLLGEGWMALDYLANSPQRTHQVRL